METIDLNDLVTVKLTQSGAEYLNILNAYKNKFAFSDKDCFKTDYMTGDEYSDDLHGLMHDFKEVLHTGA